MPSKTDKVDNNVGVGKAENGLMLKCPIVRNFYEYYVFLTQEKIISFEKMEGY